MRFWSVSHSNFCPSDLFHLLCDVFVPPRTPLCLTCGVIFFYFVRARRFSTASYPELLSLNSFCFSPFLLYRWGDSRVHPDFFPSLFDFHHFVWLLALFILHLFVLLYLIPFYFLFWSFSPLTSTVISRRLVVFWFELGVRWFWPCGDLPLSPRWMLLRRPARAKCSGKQGSKSAASLWSAFQHVLRRSDQIVSPGSDLSLSTFGDLFPLPILLWFYHSGRRDWIPWRINRPLRAPRRPGCSWCCLPRSFLPKFLSGSKLERARRQRRSVRQSPRVRPPRRRPRTRWRWGACRFGLFHCELLVASVHLIPFCFWLLWFSCRFQSSPCSL